MIDELELAFDDEPVERWRHRRGRKRGQKKRRGGAGKSVVALLVVVVMLGALGAGVWYGFDRVQGFFTTPDYEGAGQGEVTVSVEQGDTATDIANKLVKADVVKSAKAFTDAAQDDPRSQKIQPGTYKLRLQMSGVAALGMLLDLKNKIVNGVTIPEGLSAKAAFKKLSEFTKIPIKDFEEAAKDPLELGVPDWWFNRSDGKKVTPTIEGFLFPDTYEIDPKWTAADIVRTMVDRFLTVTGEMKIDEKAQALNLTPYDVLITASLAQAEAGIKEDLGKVARVAYNRIYGDFPCNCLEMDVTVNYWRELKGLPIKPSKDMTASELDDPKNPYNRKLKGLPPTPINNPGKDALEGAASPPQGNWLYFVAIDKSGKSAFTNDFGQHRKNQQTAKENGVL